MLFSFQFVSASSFSIAFTRPVTGILVRRANTSNDIIFCPGVGTLLRLVFSPQSVDSFDVVLRFSNKRSQYVYFELGYFVCYVVYAGYNKLSLGHVIFTNLRWSIDFGYLL